MKENAPEKIYLTKLMLFAAPTISNSDNDVEYIRKDVVDDMLATAEDHAYFAGSERAKEKLTDTFIEKACEWIKEKWDANYTMPIIIDGVIEDFKSYMKGE